MSRSALRRPLALAAVLATSVGAVATASSASATTWGAASSPFTISDGSAQIQVVGGGAVTAPAPAADVAWSGAGGRFAYLSGGAVYTADADGSHPVLVAPANGTQRSHLVWDDTAEFLIWSEGSQLVTAPSNGFYAERGLTPDTLLEQADQAPAGSADSWPDVAADDTTVFQRTTGSTSAVYAERWDGAAGKTVVWKVADDARQPSISPDGTTVAFIRSATDVPTGQNADEIFTVAVPAPGAALPTPVRVGLVDPANTAATNHADPVFSADGTSLAFSVDGAQKGTYRGSIAPGASNAETKISDVVGTIGVRTDAKGFVERFAGVDRIDTAVQASRMQWGTHGSGKGMQAASAVLSRSDLFADALGGAALAAHKGGPLLLTDTASLNPAVSAELTRTLGKGATVYLLGGTAALSGNVEAQIRALGFVPARLAGSDRYTTSLAIAGAVTPNPQRALVATGDNYADALSAGAVAASAPDTVVVLTAGTTAANATMPDATEAYLEKNINGKVVVAVGGQGDAALKNAGWDHYKAIVGADRFQTSYLLAKDQFFAMGAVGVATGLNWADALSGGAFLGQWGGPLLLVDPAVGLTPQDAALIDANKGAVTAAFEFGGNAALPAKVDAQLQDAVRTPLGVLFQVNGVPSSTARGVQAAPQARAAHVDGAKAEAGPAAANG